MEEVDKAKSQKPNVELVDTGKLKHVVDQIKIDPSDLELRLCNPFFLCAPLVELRELCAPVCHPVFEPKICGPIYNVLNDCQPVRELAVIEICGPSIQIKPPGIEEVINPVAIKELDVAVKALTNEVQELKEKIGKIYP